MSSPEIEQANGKSKPGIDLRLNGKPGAWLGIALVSFTYMAFEK